MLQRLFILCTLLAISYNALATQAGPYTKHDYQPTELPRLQYGLLTLQNTLTEPIKFSLETYINATDPERFITIRNGDKKAKGSGTIPAQTTQALQTYPTPVLDRSTQTLLPIFGGYVLLKLKREADADTSEYNGRVDKPGSYAITLDQAGNLALNKQMTEAEAKANK